MWYAPYSGMVVLGRKNTDAVWMSLNPDTQGQAVHCCSMWALEQMLSQREGAADCLLGSVGEETEEWLSKGCRVSIWEDETLLKMLSAHECTYAAEQCTSHG